MGLVEPMTPFSSWQKRGGIRSQVSFRKLATPPRVLASPGQDRLRLSNLNASQNEGITKSLNDFSTFAFAGLLAYPSSFLSITTVCI